MALGHISLPADTIQSQLTVTLNKTKQNTPPVHTQMLVPMYQTIWCYIATDKFYIVRYVTSIITNMVVIQSQLF